MTTQLTTHQNFFKHTTALANELATTEQRVKEQEQQLFSKIKQLTQAVKQASQTKQPVMVGAAIQGYFADTNQVLEAWQTKVNSYEAGLSFRKKFGDSLLVFVYGKVKAGKSSLGNYIATGNSKPDSAWMKKLPKLLHKPEFFIEETNQKFAEAINHEQGFQVGADETTSCIQGFTVPGMTWVDSPGLHSINTENGDLAQKYVESADLIIYPMNSAQASRGTDLEELEALLKTGKRILVLITRSDLVDIDYDDETGDEIKTLMMKSDKDRQDQEEYTQQKLSELCEKLSITGADTSAITVSIVYAEHHHNSPEAMQASGLQNLFEKLQGILSSEGINLKKQVPENNLKAFYRALLEEGTALSFSNLLTPLEEALGKLADQKQQLEAITKQAQHRINYQLANKVDSLVETHAESRDVQALNKALEEAVAQAIADEYQQPLKDLYQTTLGTLVTATQGMGLCVDLNFADKTQDITVDISQKSAAVGGGAGGVIGGLVGFLLAGPAGMVAGSMAGGLVGAKAGSYFNSQETQTIVYGDNREEVKNMLIQKSQELVNRNLLNIKNQADIEVLQPVDTAIKQVHQQAITLKNYIEGSL